MRRLSRRKIRSRGHCGRGIRGIAGDRASDEPQLQVPSVFFIDNDPRKIGTRIEGVPVIGPDHEVLEDIGNLPVQEIIIALPGVDALKREQVFNRICTPAAR